MVLRFYLYAIVLLVRLSCGFQTASAQEIDSSRYKIYRYYVDSIRTTLEYARFDSSLFLKDALFRDALFPSSASFRWSHFDSKADFRNATFRKKGVRDAVDFEGAKFFSYATFIGAKFYSNTSFIESEFYSYANFVGSTFSHISTFRGAFFDDRVKFDKSQFSSFALFTEGHFDSLASFVGVNFDYEVDLNNALFESNADFRRTSFKSKADINKVIFKSEVNFNNVDFKAEVSFKETDFDSLANFTGVNFGSEAIFEKTKFISKADFNRSFFKSNVSLKNVVFGSSGSFSDAKFGGEVLLDSCLLPDTLYFNSVETAKEIDFTYALTNTLQQSNKKCVIDLYGTDIQKLKFDYSRFKVLTDSSKYNKAQLSNIYQQLLKMQRDKGFTDGEEDVDKEYRHFKLTYDKAGFAYLLGAFGSWIQRVWWDYGYHKELIVLWTIVFLLFFTFINIFLFTYLNEKVYKIENIYNPEKYRETSNSISKRSPILTGISLTWFSTLMKSFFYTSLIFFGLKLSIEKIHFEHPGGAMYLIIQYTLGLVCLAYLANFIILS